MVRWNIDAGDASRGPMVHPYGVTELKVRLSVEKKQVADTTDRKFRVVLP